MKHIYILLLFLVSSGWAEFFDLSTHWDSAIVLENPDKGWYHHYFDNSIDKYLTKADSDLDNFPGMHQLYLRLVWSYLEPQQGQFNWELIDDVINKWAGKGYSISFRITCRETGIKWATPQWVYELGAKGKFFDNWGLETFEPDYGDSLFLEKLNQFHTVFAQRYDGQPWLDWVEVGSYGEWGEGHTSFGSNDAWSNHVIKKHIDIYVRHYKKSRIVASEDFLHHRSEADASELRQYMEEHGIAWRDDSILVKWYVDTFPVTFSVAMPQVFQETWQTRPTIVELEHYHQIIQDGNWQGLDGTIKGAEILRGACNIMHPTWIGYHGYADKWLSENPNLSKELANKVGYWYFPKFLNFPDIVFRGQETKVEMGIENFGYAPAYQKYRLIIKLEGNNQTCEQFVTEIDNRKWRPGESAVENFSLYVPSYLPEGDYVVKIKMVKDFSSAARPVYFALSDAIRDIDNFYQVGYITVKRISSNRTPQIQLNVSPLGGNAPLDVFFDASESSDANGDTLKFLWDFGDGYIDSGRVISHIFEKPGINTILLSLYDGKGGCAQARESITVNYIPPPVNKLPNVVFSIEPQSGDIPLAVNFDASMSIDPNGDDLSFFWDFGDGFSASGSIVQHTFDYTGEYQTSLLVDDGHDIYNWIKKEAKIFAGHAIKLSGQIIGTEGSKGDTGNTRINVFDGDPATFFEGPDRDSSWVGLDLDGGKGKTAHVVKIAYIPKENSGIRMVNGIFQGALLPDFSDAVNLYKVTESPENNIYTFALLNDSQPFRYMRYLGPQRSYCAVAEIEFYGAYLTSIEKQKTSVNFFNLAQNAPNPFNPRTKITYQLPIDSNVLLEVFDCCGRKVATLVDKYQSAGSYQIEFNGSTLASGIYFYQFKAEEFHSARSMVLLK